MKGRKLGPRNGLHFSYRVQLHGARAEWNHCAIKCQILIGQVAQVTHHPSFAVIGIKNRVRQVLTGAEELCGDLLPHNILNTQNRQNFGKEFLSCFFIKGNAQFSSANFCEVNSLRHCFFVDSLSVFYNYMNRVKDDIFPIVCRCLKACCKTIYSLCYIPKTYRSMPHRIEGTHVRK